MPPLIDLAGRRFGRFVVVRRNDGMSGPEWICICDCGTEKSIAGQSLRDGVSQSCGCLRREQLAARSTTHGNKSRTAPSPEYQVWSAMLGRCRNEKNRAFKNYGARGIIVCERWQRFENFLADMGLRPGPRHTLERNNNDGNYEPGNCRWATYTEQARNRRSNVRIEFVGMTMTIADWAQALGLLFSTLSSRIGHGWSKVDVLTIIPCCRQKTAKRRSEEEVKRLAEDYLSRHGSARRKEENAA